MKSIRSIVSIMLIAAFAFALALPAAAEKDAPVTGVCGEHLTWSLNTESGELTISGTGMMYDYAEEDGELAPWRACANLVRSVRIENGAASIGECAFYECWALESLSLPSSLTYIGYEAFEKCYSLTSVVIPNGVTAIAPEAFRGCSALNSVVLPSGLTELGDRVFAYCTALESISIPSGITVLDVAAFTNCCALREVTLPSTLKTISSYAFSDCWALCEITIPDKVKTIDSQAFYRCKALNKITFMGNKPTSVGDLVFKDTRDDLIILYRPQNASNWAPSGQQYWQGVPIAPVGTTLDRPTLSGSFGPFSWSLSTASGALSITGSGSMIEAAGDTPLPWKDHKEYITAVTVGEGITDLKEGFCDQSTALRSVSLPSTLTCVGPSAFCYCTALTGIELPEGLEKIDFQAFFRCGALRDLDIPSGVAEMGMDAFAECKSLKSITIPDGVSGIHSICMNCYALNEVHLGAGLSIIGDYSFEGCFALREIVIPASVTRIDYGAFYECWSLTSITFPAGIERIDNSVCRECYFLSRAVFEGEPPAVFGNEVFHNTAGDFTICYYSDFAEAWAPNDETEWHGYPLMMLEGAALTPGDADGNGSVTSADALAVLRYVLGMAGGVNVSAADVNGDGAVDASDALLILRMAIGLS